MCCTLWRRCWAAFSACEAAGSAVNQLGRNWLNFTALAVILGIFICQYQKISAKVIAVLLYMGPVVVAEPAGYVIYRTFEFDIFCRIKTGKRLRVYRKSVCQGTHSGCAACAGRRIGDYTDA